MVCDNVRVLYITTSSLIINGLGTFFRSEESSLCVFFFSNIFFCTLKIRSKLRELNSQAKIYKHGTLGLIIFPKEQQITEDN